MSPSLLGALWLLACSPNQDEAPAPPAQPEALAGQGCAVCGMIVREQPPPRGQALHRDGTHLHFCSLGDLRAHLDAPSPHGKVRGTWVEVLPAEWSPSDQRTAALPTLPAEEAWYVGGIERAGVMGLPLLSVAEQERARALARQLDGRVLRWSELRRAPAHELPPAAE